ncbi:MAG: CBS domain-containing protein, partial [Chloroflexi bacterium]
MLYPVEKLLEGRGKPLCSQHDEKVKDALIKMVENNYSQLPIVDKEGNLTGVIAEQTITRSYYHLGEEISVLDLSVEHCQEPARSLTIDSDLFDVLDQLKSTYAVVIVDDRKPTGILTDYDTIHFFRDLYEGLILVEDIEINLRQIIESAFPTQEELDNALIITSGANKRDPSKPNKSYDRMTFGGYIYFIKNEKIW